MAEPTFYKEVELGTEIPSLVKKRVTTRQLVRWAGASGDYYEIHYDKDFAQGKGMPKVIIHGALVASFLAQMLADWVEGSGYVKKLSTSYKSVHLVEEDVICQGRVTNKYMQGGEYCIECQVWAGNLEEEKKTLGTAIITMVNTGSLSTS